MHAIQKRPVVVDDQIVIRPMMYLALSYDHRLIDGREAVSFLVRIKECIENPERMMLELYESGSGTSETSSSSITGSPRMPLHAFDGPLATVRSGRDRGGPGGYVAAIRAAQLGMKVACVEKSPTPGRHVPERRLHSQQGAARFERAVPPGQGAVRQARHQGRRPDARPARDAQARKDEVVKA